MNETESKIMEMAKKYQCEDNELLQILARQYSLQIETIETLNYATRALPDSFDLLTYATQIAKLNDSALKAFNQIQKLLKDYGTKPVKEVKTVLSELLDSDDWDDDE